jgi:hypothetical protein
MHEEITEKQLSIKRIRRILSQFKFLCKKKANLNSWNSGLHRLCVDSKIIYSFRLGVRIWIEDENSFRPAMEHDWSKLVILSGIRLKLYFVVESFIFNKKWYIKKSIRRRHFKNSFKESNKDKVKTTHQANNSLQGSYRKLLGTCVNLRLRKLNKTLVKILDVGSYFLFSINTCNFFVIRVGSYFLETLNAHAACANGLKSA